MSEPMKTPDEDAENPYCETCGSCGENGCCNAVNCKYPHVKSEEITDLREYVKELEAKIARLEREAAEKEARG